MSYSTTNRKKYQRLNSFVEDWFYQQMELTKDVFELRDQTDAEELLRDTQKIISGANHLGYERIWILTNNNQEVVNRIKRKLKQDWRHIKNLGINEIKYFPYSKQEKTFLDIKAHADYHKMEVGTLVAISLSYGPTQLFI